MVFGENVICACRFQRMEKCEISMQITGRKGAACGVIVMYEVRSRCMETGFDGWEIEGFHSAKGERVKWNNAVGKLDVDYGRCLSSGIPPAFDKLSIHLSCVCSCSSLYLRHSMSVCWEKDMLVSCLHLRFQCICILIKTSQCCVRELFKINF